MRIAARGAVDAGAEQGFPEQLFRGTEESGAAVIPAGVSLLAIAGPSVSNGVKLMALS